MGNIVSTGQKWAQLEKGYLHSGQTYDTKISMAFDKGGDLSACKSILIYFQFFDQVKN